MKICLSVFVPISIFVLISFTELCYAVNHTVPKGKILIFGDDEDDRDLLDARARNKSHKILTRPLQTTTVATPYNPYFLYPQGPGFTGDSMAQGSVQQAQINNQHQQIQQASNNQDDTAKIPDIYVQLIGAIEKLVGRMDKLDGRLRTVENIIYHMTNKKEELPEQGSCPNDFRKVEGVRGKCYQISSFVKNPKIFDWKSAENECTKVGGRLAEMLNYEDFVRVSQFLLKYGSLSNSATSDYWIGGINPGLIWIWAESGQPVEMNNRFWNDNDNSSTAPGCLKLSYSHRLNTYFFKHSPCGHAQNYICEVMDNTVSRALAHFEEQLWTQNALLADSSA